MAANGFTNFTTQDASGNAGVAGAASNTTSASTAVASTSAAVATLAVGTADQCSAQVAAG